MRDHVRITTLNIWELSDAVVLNVILSCTIKRNILLCSRYVSMYSCEAREMYFMLHSNKPFCTRVHVPARALTSLPLSVTLWEKYTRYTVEIFYRA